MHLIDQLLYHAHISTQSDNGKANIYMIQTPFHTAVVAAKYVDQLDHTYEILEWQLIHDNVGSENLRDIEREMAEKYC